MVTSTHQQQDSLDQLLRERRRVLLLEIREGLRRSDDEHYRDIAGSVEDTGDESVAHMLVEVGIAEIDRDVRELRDVEAALARLSSQHFGLCCDCGISIAYARLRASPTAERCLPCQRRHEHNYAHDATPTL